MIDKIQESWQEALVRVDTLLKDILVVLNDLSDYRIVLVVDSNRKLLGTITDGDVRRAIMQHFPLTTTAEEIMNPHPCSIHESESNEKIKLLLDENGLLQIPILNDAGCVVGIETLQHLLKKDFVSNQVIIMAGGYGKRLKPLTDDCPKPMLSIAGKPLLEHIITDFIGYGFRNFTISVHYLQEVIKNYFGSGETLGANIHYHYESTPLGTAGSLSTIANIQSTELPYLVINGDILTKLNYLHLLNFHRINEADITLCAREHTLQIPYGVVKHKAHKLVSIEEKPEFRNFVNAGIYVINPDLLRNLKSNQYYLMTDLIQDALKKNKKIVVFPIHEYWMDVGRMKDYNDAQAHFSFS